MPAGKLIMMNKRKHEEEPDESRAKRRRKRSRSEPRHDTNNPEKREVLRRLFGRCASEENSRPVENEVKDDVFVPDGEDDAEDPLLDTVPVNLDPEQLGFLMCAQETLRFLQERGLTQQHPMLARLRLHFIDSFHHIAMA